MATAETTRAFRSFRVRHKAESDTGNADPARHAYVDPNSFIVTVGGTASDGDYVTTITPTAPGVDAIPITVTRDTTPATNDDIAAEFVTEANTLLLAANPRDTAALATYIESVSSSGAVVQFIVKRDAPPFTVVTSETTATGTLTLSPDDTFPLTLNTLGWAPQPGARTHLALVLVPVDSSGAQLPAGTLTADVTVRRVIERSARSPDRDIPELPVLVASATTQSALAAGAEYRIAGGGGRFGVSLGAVAGAVGSGTLAFLDVWMREVTE